jgi:UDP-glucose 4-epimerase
MRVAVTGASGRLGAYVLRALAAHEVRVVDLTPPAGFDLDFRTADLRDFAALQDGLRDIETVVHLGGIDRSVAIDDAATMQVNVMGTWNLFEASRRAGVRRVVHCSSNSVTGLDQTNPTMPPAYLPIDEAHPARPTDAYALSKRGGELIAEAFSRQGLEVLVLRPCFIAFPQQIKFMAGGGNPTGRDEPVSYLCAYVSPEDCARAFAAAVALIDYAGFETFFLAAADTFAMQPTVARLESLYGATITPRDPGLYENFPRASPISSQRAASRLDWIPSTRWSGDRLVQTSAITK